MNTRLIIIICIILILSSISAGLGIYFYTQSTPKPAAVSEPTPTPTPTPTPAAAAVSVSEPMLAKCTADSSWSYQVADSGRQISKKCPDGSSVTATCDNGVWKNVGNCPVPSISSSFLRIPVFKAPAPAPAPAPAQSPASSIILNSVNCNAKMQDDGNLVLRSNSGKELWATGTYGKGTPPYRLAMQDDGNVVIYDSVNKALWATGTYGKGTGPYKLIVQDDCNFVAYDKNNTPIWASNTSTPCYEGDVNINWDHTASTAEWACGSWISNCGNKGGCNATQIGSTVDGKSNWKCHLKTCTN